MTTPTLREATMRAMDEAAMFSDTPYRKQAAADAIASAVLRAAVQALPDAEVAKGRDKVSIDGHVIPRASLLAALTKGEG